jgi:hypothetical protein
MNQQFVDAIIESPGMAARLLRGFAAINGPAGYADIEHVASLRTHDKGMMFRSLDSLCTVGVLERTGGIWSPTVDRDELERLALLAEGAEAALRSRKDQDSVRLVVTFPGSEGVFMETLKQSGPFYASIMHTEEAFLEMAAMAKQRLVVMTPFLDAEGLAIVKKMFSTTVPELKKILILRDISKLMGMEFGPELAALETSGVQFLDYLVAAPYGRGRYETFHSKVILCDNQVAYIGSANLSY